jgi:hypothetical protein
MRVVMRLTILYNTLWIPQEHRSRDGLMRRLRGLQLKYRLSRVQNAEHQQVGLFYSNVKGVMAWMNLKKIPVPLLMLPTLKYVFFAERDGGCMHMVCVRAGCGFDWCWVCQTEWTRDCMSAHWFG